MKILGITTQKKFEVAVFVLTYNQIQYVVECLESILKQKFRNSWHIFVHDDASSDGTKEILEAYYSKYPDKITLLLQDENQFQLGRTIGIDLFKYSCSNFIAYCEGDDFWTSKRKLKNQFRFMKRNQWCALLHSAVEVRNEDGWILYEEKLKELIKNKIYANKRTSGSALTKGNFIMTCSTLFRRSEMPEDILDNIGDLQPLDFILFSLVTRFKDIGFQKKIMSTYRLHSKNYFASQSNSVIKIDHSKTISFLNSVSPRTFVNQMEE